MQLRKARLFSQLVENRNRSRGVQVICESFDHLRCWKVTRDTFVARLPPPFQHIVCIMKTFHSPIDRVSVRRFEHRQAKYVSIPTLTTKPFSGQKLTDSYEVAEA